MALNEVLRDADHISLPVPASTKAGSPVKVGSIVGVTETDEGKGGNPTGYATVWCKGAHKFPVASGGTLAIGDPVYITSGNALTPVSTSNTLFGYALQAKVTGAVPALLVKISRV